MATRIKTVQYHFPVLASLANNTLTNLPQLSITLPENSKQFRSVFIKVTADDIITATGGSISTKTINLRLGSASYTSSSDATAVGHTGENISWVFHSDFTNHFISNWSGTSMTCDVQVLINQTTGTTLGFTNVCATLYITYEFDDTSTTQIKTVYIPLAQIIGALPTSKPGTAQGIIPALNSYLPENSKTYINTAICFWGNTNAASTTDHSVTMQIDSDSSITTGNYEAALSSDRYTEFHWVNPSFDTSTTHNFFIWTSVGGVTRHHNPLLFMVVTYTFNATNTTRVMNSVLLPFFDEPLSNNSTIPNSVETELSVQEPNVTLERLGLLVWYQNHNSTNNTFARIGSGSFVGAFSTGGSAVICGNHTFMLINNNPTGITFQRGTVRLFFEFYNTGTYKHNHIVGMWILNYSSGVSSFGLNAHNKTIFNAIDANLLSVAFRTTPSRVPLGYIPETNYYLNHNSILAVSTITSVYLCTINIETLTSENFNNRYILYDTKPGYSDLEAGIFYLNFNINQSLIKKFPSDMNFDNRKIDIKNPRYFIFKAFNSLIAPLIASIYTYHSISYTISGKTYDNNGNILSNAVVYLFKVDTAKSKFIPYSATISDTNGDYSFTVYDNTDTYFAVARKVGTPNIFDVTDFTLQGA